MKPINLGERKNKIVLFGVMLAVIFCLVFLLAAAIIKGGDNTTGNVTVDNNAFLSAETDKLFGYNEKLQARMVALQELDKQYSSVVTDSTFAQKADSLNELIDLEENVFRASISNVSQGLSSLTDSSSKTRLQKMVASYQSQLEGRRAIANLRNAVAMQNNSFSTDEKAMLEMQNQLLQKNNEIAALETSIKEIARAKKAKEPVAGTATNDKNRELMNNVAELQNTITNLTSYNSSLKQENEKQLRLQNENIKKIAGNEALLKEKALTLQQKVDALNADLQLAHVDCNLSRVDALQIISNAKQRKQLLSEASTILTSLSTSANDDVKKKIKDKINRLNQVAANSRE